MSAAMRRAAEALRVRSFRALGLPAAAFAGAAACASGERDMVQAPLASPGVDAGTDAALDPPEAGTDAAARHATRPLREPLARAGCQRTVHCRAADAEEPTTPFPEPFARCAPLLSKADRDTQFSPKETAKARARDASVCCYVEFHDCESMIHVIEGRALRVSGRVILPETAGTPHAARGESVRARAAARWSRAAEQEHASVATFARLSLELTSLGAPPDLVARCHRAALDEVRHARDAYAIASRYAGVRLEARAMPLACAPLSPDLVRLARETLRDGCVSESAAALVARDEAARAEDSAEKRALLRVAGDEARHAELAFRMLAWALCEGGDAVRDAITRELASLDAAMRDAREPARIAFRLVVTPLVSALLASRAVRSGTPDARRSSR